MKTRNKYVT